MGYVIRANVRQFGEDDFRPMFAGDFFIGSRIVGWYSTPKCANEFKSKEDAQEFFIAQKKKLLQNPEFSVAFDTVEICKVIYQPIGRIDAV